ncbi:MAG: hypothetical protein WB689_30340, partial [Xanthobacteraceae bacterium]
VSPHLPRSASSPIDSRPASDTIPNMGFNRRKMEDQRQQAAEKEAAERRATDAQVLEGRRAPDRRLE